MALLCLTLNVYKEARGESPAAQRDVAHVTINRAIRRQKDICTIVMQEKQFSWTITDISKGVLRKGKHPDRHSDAWKTAHRQAIIATYSKDTTQGATHFHTDYVSPYWSKDKSIKFLFKRGKHLFYRRIS